MKKLLLFTPLLTMLAGITAFAATPVQGTPGQLGVYKPSADSAWVTDYKCFPDSTMTISGQEIPIWSAGEDLVVTGADGSDFIYTGQTSSLAALQAGEHYYRYERTGDIPIAYWVRTHEFHTCIHSWNYDDPDFMETGDRYNTSLGKYEWEGIPYEWTYTEIGTGDDYAVHEAHASSAAGEGVYRYPGCGQFLPDGWIGYCADCMNVNTSMYDNSVTYGLVYASAQTIWETLS